MRIPAVVIGATGYVGGELLRLLHAHPNFVMAAAVSESRAGERISKVFPHLAGAYDDTTFAAPREWSAQLDRGARLALFSAAPHGASASLLAAALDDASARDLDLHIVDSSADFRYNDADAYRNVYGVAHGAPHLLSNFHCAVPEHAAGVTTAHIGHPGCFATAVLLAAVPLVHAGLPNGDLYVTGVTGSTGSGRSPQDGTHHPERHSNYYAYKPLVHRHVPEIETLIANACGTSASIRFVPHSGPFARGIHVTLQAKLASSLSANDIREIYSRYYRNAEFVRIVDGTPRLKDVVASNYSHIGVATSNESVVVMCVIDNLVKGAAGGAVQWMNRLWSLPESSGLLAAAPSWT
ncbi:MAG TPA: N-acetyl-gamma-glutamyl-phosphate reductase [Woeseiaceae bacterium]